MKNYTVYIKRNQTNDENDGFGDFSAGFVARGYLSAKNDKDALKEAKKRFSTYNFNGKNRDAYIVNE